MVGEVEPFGIWYLGLVRPAKPDDYSPLCRTDIFKLLSDAALVLGIYVNFTPW